METDYYVSLSNEDKLRYDRKLTLANGMKLDDPYSIATGWISDITKLPSISWSDVTKYLTDTPSEYTKEAVKAFKSLDGYEFFREGHVQDCFYHETTSKSFCFIKSKVLPSQRQSKSAKMYDVWVVINIQHGWVLTGNCTCMAGLGSVCSHVAALLFKLEAANHYKLNAAVACTSQLCAWKATKRFVEPAAIKNINFKRVKKHELPIIKVLNPNKGNYSAMDPSYGDNMITKEQFSDLFDKNKQAAVFTSINMSTISGTEDQEKNKQYISDTDSDTENDENLLPEPITSLFDPTAINLLGKELAAFSLKQYQSYEGSYTQMAYNHLCEVTRTQSLSPIWMLHRAGRITASSCFHMSKTSIDKPSKSLVHKIMQYETSSSTSNKYTEHGKKYEAEARKLYTSIFSRKHEDVKVTETGFHVKATLPFLGASPDGIVSCNCHPTRILEIKCPFNYMHGFTSWENDKSFPITNEGKMKTNHPYFYQMQMQMFICDVSHGDFFMYSSEKPKDYFLLTICLDNSFMDILVKDLWLKFQACILPEIVTRKGDEVENDRKLFCKCRHPAFGQMIACDSANCDIEWFHYPCVEITRAPKGPWLCEQCRSK